ncbi:MAG: hypothetical protein LBB18_00570 [Puniceicoccales bacterium]|nr:hypothetical protein [Puniceicoccales bacterium]
MANVTSVTLPIFSLQNAKICYSYFRLADWIGRIKTIRGYYEDYNRR